MDVTTLSLIGRFEDKALHTACLRLTTDNQSSVDKYQSRMEQQMEVHNVHQRLATIKKPSGYPAAQETVRQMEALNIQTKEI